MLFDNRCHHHLKTFMQEVFNILFLDHCCLTVNFLLKKSSNFVCFGLKNAKKHQFSDVVWHFDGENEQNLKFLCLNIPWLATSDSKLHKFTSNRKNKSVLDVFSGWCFFATLFAPSVAYIQTNIVTILHVHVKSYTHKTKFDPQSG